ncbi:hypothetical protein JVW19_20185, partial [Vibrio cholerae O1]|nr:hypothetical protein [Vibrio cholerae O1]
VKGKRVVMVDDSIVRGTTSRRIVQFLKEAGATEVHVAIGSPALAYPESNCGWCACHDSRLLWDLIAHNGC